MTPESPPGDTPPAGRPASAGRPAPARRHAPAARRARATPAPLLPLGENERPVPLLIAVAVCLALSIGVAVGTLTIHDLSRRGGSLPAGLFLACVLALLARGMYARRYGAVLGFEALLAFQVIVTSLALVVASTLLAAGICLVSVLLAGWLFWKLVRVMGRIQAGER
jgi:hypothetical protein